MKSNKMSPNYIIDTSKDMIDTPALLVDVEKMEYNIHWMAEFLKDAPSQLRPHFKTHKTPALAQKQLAAGAIGMTCAKLSEAEILVKNGIHNILIANQIIGSSKITRLADLAKKALMIVAVDHEENIIRLSEAAQKANSQIRILIEVNIGLNRCGVAPGEPALDLARIITQSPNLHFSGLLGYEGHAVFLADKEKRKEVVDQSIGQLVGTANLIRNNDIPVEIISAGGTGTYDLTGMYPGVTEVEAGSYILMDTRYRNIGLPFQCALTLLATIISRPTPERGVIDAGKKSLTIDHGLPEIIKPDGLELISLNEEHGILKVTPKGNTPKVGDKVEIIPSHVCTTVNLHNTFYAIRKGRLEETWSIEARGKST